MQTFGQKVLLIVVAVLLSLLVAVLAGMLSHATGTSLAGAVLYGGGAFILWMTLSVTVMMALGLLRQDQ